MALIWIWAGYVAADDARVYLISFDGERIGGMSDRNAQRTFYRVHDRRVVVHEVRRGRRRGGITYNQALVYVFGDLDQACWGLATNRQRIAQTRDDAALPPVEAPTLTLEEWARGVGSY